MGQLIDDLLKFSNIGRSELHKISFSANLPVESAIKILHPSFEGRDISWEIDKLPEITADYTLMSLVWICLIENAVKFTQMRSKAAIKISCSELQHEYVFSVTDNGIGFDMKYVGKLFGVFQRLHSSTEFEGTGIGLANIRLIIALHGGKTWAESIPDTGTTLSFTLPKVNC